MEKDLSILEKIIPTDLYILGLDMGLGYQDDCWLDKDGLDKFVSYHFDVLKHNGSIGTKLTNLRMDVYHNTVEATFLNEVKKAKEQDRDLCVLFNTTGLIEDSYDREICYKAFHKALVECGINKLIIFCPEVVFPIMEKIGVGMDLTLISIRGNGYDQDYITHFDLYTYLDERSKKTWIRQ